MAMKIEYRLFPQLLISFSDIKWNTDIETSVYPFLHLRKLARV